MNECKNLESKINSMWGRVDELCNFNAHILKNLSDEGTTIADSDTTEVLCLASEKLDYVITELQGLKKEIEFIENFESIVFED